MKLTSYYSLYNRFKTGKTITLGIKIAQCLGIRHLLLRMDTNFVCNLRCKTCYFSSPNAKKLFVPPMKLDLFKAIAKDVFPRTRILFLSCGGEPLMTKNFSKFIEIATQYSVPYIGYVTNGLLFTEEIIRSGIENKVSEITISIDGATKETYERIRVGGNFDKLIEKLELYKTIASSAKGFVPLLRFNFTVTRSNHLEMPLLVDLAHRYGINLIKFRIYVDWGGSLSFENESLIGYEQSFNRSLKEAKKRANKAGIELIAPQEFIFEKEGEIDNKKNLEINNISSPPCIYPWFFRYIDPLGRIRVCSNLPLSDYRITSEHGIDEFINSEEESKRRALLRKGSIKCCFVSVCDGAYLKRANDDINYLKKS